MLLPPTDALRLIILNNACILYIIVVASTKLVDTYFIDTVIASSLEKKFTTHEPSTSHGIAPSNLRPLRKIPHCYP